MANTLTFEQLPEAISRLYDKFEVIERFIIENYKEPQSDPDKWLNLDELIEYLPDKPARATIYGKVHQKLIPYHKQGKSLIFRKSDIDEWLTRGRIKTVAETAEEASHYLRRKGNG